MQEDIERKQELESAIKEYLSHAEMYPSRDSQKLEESGDYVPVFSMNYFSVQDDPDLYHLLVLRSALRKLMDKVDSLFDSQVSHQTVRDSIQKAFDSVDECGEFSFPIEADERARRFHDKVYELLSFHYGRRYDAIVPMYQLECANSVEFPLANAVLYSGGQRSLLAGLVNDDTHGFFESDKNQIEKCSYLKFPVTGDSHSLLEQAEHESERALQVLRFIYPWFEKDGKTYNPAHGASMWKQSARTLLYQPMSATNHRCYWNSGIPNGIRGTLAISSELLNDAQEFYGLDDINYHCQHIDCNSVSRRICRALSFYDAASKTPDIHFAFSNFIISVDILLPPKNVRASVLTGHLKSLIEYAKYYTGEMNLNEDLADPKSTTWPERVHLTTLDFKDFYRIRGQILHGNDEKYFPISKSQARKARQIAHNAIRAYAYLAREFNWQTDQEAKRWFKNPRKPPK